MAALGIALTVAVLLAMLSLVNGLKTRCKSTGNPLNVLVLRKGSTAELTSAVSRADFQDIKFKPGIARDKAGEPMASLEMITVINLPSVDAPDGINVNLRGLKPDRHRDARRSSWFRPLVHARPARSGRRRIHREALPQPRTWATNCASAAAIGTWSA